MLCGCNGHGVAMAGAAFSVIAIRERRGPQATRPLCFTKSVLATAGRELSQEVAEQRVQVTAGVVTCHRS
jgi:hypothetical protein